MSFRGSVNFGGHFDIPEPMSVTFSNPVIRVNSATSGSITVGGATYALNLGSASKSTAANGAVTWSNVAVIGSFSGSGSGGGAAGGGSSNFDPLTFTVGAVNSANFGSTVTRAVTAVERTAAATPPAAEGLDVITSTDDLVAGGDIEITASGFQPNETGILVVIYSEPTVLDTNAKADENGVVRWIGTLPEGLTGEHTITLQGSINVGQVVTIGEAVDQEVAELASASGEAVEDATAISADAGTPAWVWWTAALALLVVAGAGAGLVVAQRRKAGASTQL